MTSETRAARSRVRQALGIQDRTARAGSPRRLARRRRRALLIEGSVLVEVRDLENVIAQGGQLVSAEGVPLPVRMTVEHPKPVVAGPVATLILDAASAAEAERKLWASLTSTADGLVDRFFNRPLGRPLSKLLVRTPISPNQVSIVSILIGLASAWFFARGNFVTGALVFQLCAIIDCVDGDLARALFKQSRLGKWLDLGGDQVVHFSVFAAHRNRRCPPRSIRSRPRARRERRSRCLALLRGDCPRLAAAGRAARSAPEQTARRHRQPRFLRSAAGARDLWPDGFVSLDGWDRHSRFLDRAARAAKRSRRARHVARDRMKLALKIFVAAARTRALRLVRPAGRR